jgi:hypothetical protein
MFIKFLITALLIFIFYQDLRYKAVYWTIFPFLWLLLLINEGSLNILTNGLYNLSFFGIQLFLLSLYFSFKNKKWVNITNGYLGWGDIVFLIVVAFYMAPLNFFIFYLGSLIVIIISIMLIYLGRMERQYKIPLAGIQSLLYAILLVLNWFTGDFNLQDDEWLLSILSTFI